MGCVFNYVKLGVQEERSAVKSAMDTIDNARYESGPGGYSGTFAEAQGVEVAAYQPTSDDDARTWLDDNCEKWGPALLIKDVDGAYHLGAQCSD